MGEGTFLVIIGAALFNLVTPDLVIIVSIFIILLDAVITERFGEPKNKSVSIKLNT